MPVQPATTRQRARTVHVGIVGLMLVIAGTATELVAIVAAPWWASDAGAAHTRLDFRGIGSLTQRGFAFMYFAWGAWLLAGIALGLGVAACVHWRGAHAFRVAAGLFGVAAAFVPIAAVLVFAYESHTEAFQVARNYGIGVYLAVLGLLATAFGAAAGGGR
jgi:hypothetical protein